MFDLVVRAVLGLGVCLLLFWLCERLMRSRGGGGTGSGAAGDRDDLRPAS